jgi:hypothetical protein
MLQHDKLIAIGNDKMAYIYASHFFVLIAQLGLYIRITANFMRASHKIYKDNEANVL